MTQKGIISLLILLAGLYCSVQQTWAQATISGYVYGGYTKTTSGIPNVPVTDGFTTVLTDAKGYYSFTSNKKSGIVYITMPSGYQMFENYKTTDAQKIFSPYWQAFTYANNLTKAETHDFRLKAVDNTHHKMIFLADPQICGRKQNGSENVDKRYYQDNTVYHIKQEVADAGTTPIYSISLGDEVFDEYWYSYSFTPSSFVALNVSYGYPTKMFPTMGNHDNDPSTPYSDSVDYEAAKTYRLAMGPEYYSMNIGDIHYIFLDNIVYINTPNGKSGYNTIVGNRDYQEYVTPLQIEWLKQDLSRVSKDTPIFLSLHAPLWGVDYSYNPYALRNFASGGTYDICNMLKDYEKVEIFSGHRHQYTNSNPATYPNIREHTVGGNLGNLSWAAAYSGVPNCSDGVPGGYVLVNVSGKDYDWIFRDCVPGEEGAQFRVIDVNKWKEFYNTDSLYNQVMPKLTTSSTATTTHAYNNPNEMFPDNAVLVNVFYHDKDWKVEMFEKGKPLTVQQRAAEDIYHILAVDRKRAKSSTFCSAEMATWTTHHMFYGVASSDTSTVDIKVTDEFGNEFTRTVKLPIEISLADLTPTNETKLATGITEAVKKAMTATIYVNGSTINIDAEKEGVVTIVSIDGKITSKKLQAGHNEFTDLQRGIYIVKTADTVKKVFVK